MQATIDDIGIAHPIGKNVEIKIAMTRVRSKTLVLMLAACMLSQYSVGHGQVSHGYVKLVQQHSVRSKDDAKSALQSDLASAKVITEALRSSDPQVRREALGELKSLADRDPRVIQPNLKSHWLEELLIDARFDDIEELAIAGIASSPDNAQGCAAMQESRVRAFLAAGKYEKALAASKSFYNVCPLEESNVAMSLVAEALRHSRGQTNPSIAVRFKIQQSEGIAIPTDNMLASPPLNLDSKDIVLNSIVVDDQRLANVTWAHARDSGFWGKAAYGNLLLLIDRPEQARIAFEKALGRANDEELVIGIKNVARAIRAQDGAVGRANAYILRLRSLGGEL
jgi:tetratricopeptide (TPR) repeat protein